MKIAFHSHEINERGTCVSLYDYAHYYETILGGKSIIITSELHHNYHDNMTLYKFTKRFEIRTYKDSKDIENIVSDCDIFYTIKYGKKDEYVCKNIKTCVHCVFDLSEPHGDVYVAVSDTLAKKFSKTEFVPHMIGLKPSRTNENMRTDLNIPENAVVFGRHGGQDTFDLDIAKKAISHSVVDRPELYFVFVNTPRFINHPKVIHLDKIIDSDEKNRFIMTCDAMIHAQSLGETFGISIGEFSVNNRMIVAYNGPVWNDHYKHILGERAIWYLNEDECYNILMNFNPSKYKNEDVNCYKQYSPEKVMLQFQKTFIN